MVRVVMREHKLCFLPLNMLGFWVAGPFVGLSEGEISIFSLAVSSVADALPLWPPRRRGSGRSWWSAHELPTCVDGVLGGREQLCVQLCTLSSLHPPVSTTTSQPHTCTTELLPPALSLLSSCTSWDQSSSPRALTHSSVISASSST